MYSGEMNDDVSTAATLLDAEGRHRHSEQNK